MPSLVIPDKLPALGTTIFTVMGQLARAQQAIDLGQGFPDMPMDQRLIALVSEAMTAGHNQYAPMAGSLRLRESIARKVEVVHAVRYDPAEEVTVTAGATQAIFTAIASVVGSGDEVIIIDPAYDCYAPAVRLFGGVPVHIAPGADLRFDAGAVSAALTSRTRMLIINTPHNPAGRVLLEQDMVAISNILRDTDVLLLSDEVYEHITFHPEGHRSAMRYSALRERSFVVFSFGKVYNNTGWKVGYVLAPRELMRMFRKVHQYNVFSVNTPVQEALSTYLGDPSTYSDLPVFFKTKRDRFTAGLNGTAWKLLPCEGTYFQVMDYGGIRDESDVVFAERLIRDHGVAAIPLSPFQASADPQQRLLRFCFAKQDATLDAAIERLCRI